MKQRTKRAHGLRRGWPILLGFLALTSAGCTAHPHRAQVEGRIASIGEDSLRGHVEALTRLGPRSPDQQPAVAEACRYISEQLRSYGYAVIREPTGLRIDGFDHFNLLAELPGRTRPERVVELGAHYDSVPGSPGADDNASGVAATLEVARTLAGARPEKTIRFCFFALEELGLLGSAAHVERIKAQDSQTVEGIVVLEMVGYATDAPDTQDSPARIPLVVWPPKTGNFILVVGNFASGALGNRFLAAARAFAPGLPLYDVNRLGGFFADAARSDHSPYWAAGDPGIMVTDTANFRNPHYHRPTDSIETLNFTFMKDVTRSAAATMLYWAGYQPDEADTEVLDHDSGGVRP